MSLDDKLKLHQAQYNAAEALYDSGDREQCILLAQENLNDYSLSSFHIIKNCILITSALDNWDQAEEWRLAAEHAYNTSMREALREKDEASLAVLDGLRAELDELDEFKQEDLTGMTKEERAEMMGPLGQFQDEDDEVEEEQYVLTEEELAEIARVYGLDTDAAEGIEKMTDDMKKLELETASDTDAVTAKDTTVTSSFSVNPPA